MSLFGAGISSLTKKGDEEGRGAQAKRKVPGTKSEKILRSGEAATESVGLPPRPNPAPFVVKNFNYKIQKG
jgi:hypothetical protein